LRTAGDLRETVNGVFAIAKNSPFWYPQNFDKEFIIFAKPVNLLFAKT